MRTDAKTVGTLLNAQHVNLGRHDVVVPSVSSSLHDGLHVDVLRAFPVTVDVDGSVRTVRTAETSAENLAKQLKLGKLTAVRNQPGRLAAGSTVVFRTRISGTLKLDNQSLTFDSPSRTVDELLQSYNVHLQGDDFVVPALTTVLTDGATVTVVRVGADVTQDTRHDPVRHRAAARPRPAHRSDPGDPGRRERHRDRHVPPADRERAEGRSHHRVRGADGRAAVRGSSDTARTPTRTGTTSRSASRVDVGTPSTPTPTATTGAWAST